PESAEVTTDSSNGSTKSPQMTVDMFPCAPNGYKFQTDSPSGRTPAQLNALFRPPPRMPMTSFERYSAQQMLLSYSQIGTRPPLDLADSLIQEVEMRHAEDVKRYENENS
ncbi:hypothetical protein GQ44DRAFT_558714, partial [Phaeosphaeriaceae sp. PMI808]